MHKHWCGQASGHDGARGELCVKVRGSLISVTISDIITFQKDKRNVILLQAIINP